MSQGLCLGSLQSVDDLTSGIANGYIVGQVFYDIFMVRPAFLPTGLFLEWHMSRLAEACRQYPKPSLSGGCRGALAAVWALSC